MGIIALQIKKLRKALGYSQEKFGTVLGTSQRKITDIENDKQKVSAELLLRIAKAFSVDLDYFYDAEAEPHAADILFRAKDKMEEEDYEVVRILKRICSDQNTLEEILSVEPWNKPYRKYDIGTYRPVFNVAEEVARKEREYFELETDPILDIGSILRREGIDLVEAPLEYRISGFFFTLQNGRPFLVVNSNLQPYSKNFSIAHEYAHLLFDYKKSFNIICQELERPQKDIVEKRANAFAAEFLLPSDVVKNIQPTKYNIVRLMHDYKVSREVIVNRLRSLGTINEKAKAELSGSKFAPYKLMKDLEMENEFTVYTERSIERRKGKKRAKRTSFSVHSLLPAKYIRKAISAFRAGKITYERLSDYLYISPDELESRLEIAPPRSTKYDSLLPKA